MGNGSRRAREAARRSISVNRDLTTLALIRLLTAASVFWVAVQLCRNPARASLFLIAIATITCIYAAYGLIAFASKAWRVPVGNPLDRRLFVLDLRQSQLVCDLCQGWPDRDLWPRLAVVSAQRDRMAGSRRLLIASSSKRRGKVGRSSSEALLYFSLPPALRLPGWGDRHRHRSIRSRRFDVQARQSAPLSRWKRWSWGLSFWPAPSIACSVMRSLPYRRAGFRDTGRWRSI